MVNTILKMMGMHVSTTALDVSHWIRCPSIPSLNTFVLQEIVSEIDADGSGSLEFPEFIQLSAKFLIEEDEEQMRWELKEAFRIYDKHGEIISVFSDNRLKD